MRRFTHLYGGRSARRRRDTRHTNVSSSVSSILSNRQMRVEALECRTLLAVDVTPTFQVDEDWGSGYTGQITLQNNEPTAFSPWRLELDMAGQISDIWNAQIESQMGDHYTIVGASWNPNLPAGGSVQFGFVASPGGSPAEPTGYVLNGESLGGVSLPKVSVRDTAFGETQSGYRLAFGTVVLSEPSDDVVYVSYATADGTAEAGSDYLPKSGRLQFAPGETRKTFGIYVRGDRDFEQDETLYIDLFRPSGATIDRARAALVIKNDDIGPNTRPTAEFDSALTTEGRSVLIDVVANDSDPDGDPIRLWAISQGSHGSVAIEDGQVRYSPEAGFVGSDTFMYFVRDARGAMSAGTVSVVVSEAQANARQLFAPYVDMGLWPTYNLVDAMQNGGVEYFTLAFITADPNNRPAWGGYAAYALGSDFDAQMRTQIGGVRDLGGDVIVSFGGAANQEMAEVITDTSALAAAYQSVIDAYDLTRIDFDVEGAAVAHRASIDRRNDAIVILQQNAAAAGRTLEVSYTLPVLPTGLTPDGVYVLQSAFDRGVELAVANIMAMDYGDSAAPNPDGRMGDYAIQAANSLHAQLQSVYGTTRTEEELWGMVGITPMIGLNDVTTEIFDQQEAREVLAFAEHQDIGRLSFWSLNRDQQNPAGELNYVDLKSSSILQDPFEFSSIFGTFDDE
ncbi:MAG: hypothetical protein DWQ37_06235 [Planctomycetota bacterium]|nr:MAG: hypothetical protein DWQ37_06235 [Planctomycetota bacterium]